MLQFIYIRSHGFHSPLLGFVCTLGVGHEAVERREVACVARGDSEGVELNEAESRGST